MRTLRLGRTLDAVLVHDAVTYLTTDEDLRAAMETAFAHLRPGGAAVPGVATCSSWCERDRPGWVTLPPTPLR